MKPHRTYHEQLKLLTSRGLKCDEDEAGIAALQRIGYYRLSAYTHPLRARDTDGTVLDDFRPGYTLNDVLALYEFDDKLRDVIAKGLRTLELALRVHVSYRLGLTHAFGHLEPELALNTACLMDGGGTRESDYAKWRSRYDDRHREAASKEDFVKHFRVKYENKLPIWVATEILHFGSLTKLFEFMKATDQRSISRKYGVDNPAVLSSWLRPLTDLRNHCAHHGRIWNRKYPYPPKLTGQIPEDLVHLRVVADDRLYIRVALLAALLSRIEKNSQWGLSLRTVVRKMPAIQQVTSLAKMGFPEDWEDYDLWP